jgi:hypothetical protein
MVVEIFSFERVSKLSRDHDHHVEPAPSAGSQLSFATAQLLLMVRGPPPAWAARQPGFGIDALLLAIGERRPRRPLGKASRPRARPRLRRRATRATLKRR